MEKMNLLHLEDLRDLVPALDTGYNTVGTTVYALPEVQSPMSPHAVENYQRIAYELDNNASDTVQEWLDRRAELITGGRNPKTVSMQFDLRRE